MLINIICYLLHNITVENLTVDKNTHKIKTTKWMKYLIANTQIIILSGFLQVIELSNLLRPWDIQLQMLIVLGKNLID